MDIVIVENFCGDLRGQDNDRFVYLAALLARRGHTVELVTSDFDHSAKAHRQSVADYPFTVTLLHESGYPRNVCLRRFASHYGWGRRVAAYLKQRRRPDVVYCGVPSMTAANKAGRFCRKAGIPCFVDVQDLWPEAFQMVLHIPVVTDILFAPMLWMENAVYRKADALCAVSEDYLHRAQRSSPDCREGHAVYIGTELSVYDAHAAAHPVEKPEGRFWLGYCGTLGTSYDLPLVFAALELLRQRGTTPPHFLVMGDGPQMEAFQRMAEKKQLDVRFTGRLPYAEMCGWLAACDAVVNPIVGKSVASIINKHADYAACGKPVLNTQKSAEYRALVERYQMGFNCDSAEELAEKLALLMSDAALCQSMGANARRCAEERFDRACSYGELADAVERAAR